MSLNNLIYIYLKNNNKSNGIILLKHAVIRAPVHADATCCKGLMRNLGSSKLCESNDVLKTFLLSTLELLVSGIIVEYIKHVNALFEFSIC